VIAVLADPEIDVGHVVEAVAAVEALGTMVSAEYRKLHGVSSPGARFGDGPLEQRSPVAASGHVRGAVELADEDRTFGAGLGAFREAMPAHDETVCGQAAVSFGNLD